MANNNTLHNNRDLIIEQDTIGPNLNEADLLNNTGAGRNRFGLVRDRLFHVLLVKMALSYNQNFSYTFRRIIEFFILISALFMLFLLIYVHAIFNQFPGTCLNEIREIWPKKGVLRVEVIQNWDDFQAMQLVIDKKDTKKESHNCNFNLRDVFTIGPLALPDELKHTKTKTYEKSDNNIRIGILSGKVVNQHSGNSDTDSNKSFDTNFYFLSSKKKNLSNDSPLYRMFSLINNLFSTLFNFFDNESEAVEFSEYNLKENVSNDQLTFAKEFDSNVVDDVSKDKNSEEQNFDVNAAFVYLVEYSLHYGLLKLSPIMRQEFGIPVMLVQLDSESDKCFGDWKNRFLMRYFIGFEDIIMSSVRALAENETEKGYLRDMISGELYHFVSLGISRLAYLSALLVMLIFTFAISMLLRFSHHQIFLFIVDLLHMFELNQPLIFPVAPLLTVILALVGMEAIMSEIFNDTTTAFYVILLVWMADQYDAICCKSSIGKSYWLRFFYLYHFAFYAYHYRFSGQYSGLALLTSALFIVHSMIFFFHHYEMPLIVYQERLRRVVSDLPHNDITSTATLNVSVSITESSQNVSSVDNATSTNVSVSSTTPTSQPSAIQSLESLIYRTNNISLLTEDLRDNETEIINV